MLRILLILFLFTTANAEEFIGYAKLENKNFDQLNISGNALLKIISADSLKLDGSLKFEDLNVKNQININGYANGKNLQAENLVVNGSISGKNLAISGNTTVHGNLKVIDSKFSVIEARANEIILNNSIVQNIGFKNTEKNIQKLVLKGNSVIEGDVNFESGHGEVFVSKTSVIKGQIIGGKIITKE